MACHNWPTSDPANEKKEWNKDQERDVENLATDEEGGRKSGDAD
jgi:hypothetical protein